MKIKGWIILLIIAVAAFLFVPRNEESGTEEIKIGLPTKMFVGTPPNLAAIPRLEKHIDEERPTFLAPKGCINLALGKKVSSTDEFPIIGEIELVTDGDKEGADGSFVELGPMNQHVTIDLEEEYNIYGIIIWHYHKQARVYFDVVIEASSDPDFIERAILFNNDDDNSSGLGMGTDLNYVEDYNGKLIDSKGVKARYIRCHSRGNSESDLNHYVEIEVYGK